jgi:hypothetical protein
MKTEIDQAVEEAWQKWLQPVRRDERKLNQ